MFNIVKIIFFSSKQKGRISFESKPKLHTMKKIYFILVFILLGTFSFGQALYCNANANVIIYSNYDGGPLTINVDQNIPNLKIGIVSYEFARITIAGPYAGNVTEVRWAGYNGTNNHCSLSLPFTTTITGVANNIDTIIPMPTATYSNSNGYGLIICNYSCNDSTSQGGCNTPDQIVHYFISAFGGALYYHHTQYGCWSGTYNVSAGGNCCISPFTTATIENNTPENHFLVFPNPSNGIFHVAFPKNISQGEVKVFNLLGEEIKAVKISNNENISLEGSAPGYYFLKIITEKETFSQSIILSE